MPSVGPDFQSMCLSLEAWRFRKEHKARRAYHCRFCRQPIPAGGQYVAHSDRAAHVECVREWQALTPRGSVPVHRQAVEL